MFLHRKDILKIQEILDKFEDVDVFELDQTNSSGIGSITTMTFPKEINGLRASVDIEISGVDDW